MNRGCVVVAAAAVVVAVVGAPGCGIVALRATPGPPELVAYAGPHGRPRAFGGGVCPLRGRHLHPWPPTPSSAFVVEDGAWRDTRALVSFPGPHALGATRCATSGWHQHALPSTTSAP